MALTKPATGADARRERITAAITASPEPVTVEDLSALLGLKSSTVRADIEVLRALGSVTRTSLPREGPGRPRWGYIVAVPVANPYEVLARALATQVSGPDSVRPPEQLADQWLSRIPKHEPAETPDEAVAHAATSLQSLGFEVQVNPLGTEITMTGCPYASLVPDFPMICDIHGALLRGVLTESNQGVDVERLDVWARPGMCIASLRRPDLTPERRISADELDQLASGGDAA